MHRQIRVAVEEVSGAHQHSNEEPNVCRSATCQLVLLFNHVVQERCDRKAKFLSRQYCAPPMPFGILLVLGTLKASSDGCHVFLVLLS